MEQRESLSAAEVARRWGVGRDRVMSLVRAGKLRAFAVPSAGRYGKTVRIPLVSILEAEEAWQVLPREERVPKPPLVGAKLSHLRIN